MAQQPSMKLREQDLAQNTVEFPRRFPLAISPENRDSSPDKDARLVNCYVERDKKTGDYQLFGRPGLLTDVTKSGAGRGVYRWAGNTYAIFADKVYKDGVDMGATIDTTNGVYRFDQTSGAAPKLVFGNGVTAYYTDGTTVTEITDADFPSSFVKGWAFLDQTLYVMEPDADIKGSDLNDPTAWDPLNSITAYIEPDLGVALAKQLVYVVPMKQWSTEVFFDAANATGSPLGRVQGAKVNWGCASADSVREIDGILIWAATNLKGNQASGHIEIVILDNLKAREVSTPAVERLLEGADFSAGAVFSWTISVAGHRFYILTLKNDNLTLAYDLDEDMWSQWTDSNGDYLPIVSSTNGAGQTHILQHESNGKLYLSDPDYVNDDGALITIDVYTPNFDGGIRRIKMLDRLEFVGHQTVGSVIKVRCNDEDYAAGAWSPWRMVDMGQSRPYLQDCGSFYRRAYNFQHRCNAKFYLAAAEMTLGMGTL